MFNSDHNFDKDISKLIDLYYDALKNNNTKKLKTFIRECINRSSSLRLRIKSTMKWLIDELKANNNSKIGDVGVENAMELIDEIRNLNNEIYKKLEIKNVKTIYDLEVMLQKLISFRNILISTRYGMSTLSEYFLKHITISNNNSITTITDNRYMNDNQLDNIKGVTKIISQS